MRKVVCAAIGLGAIATMASTATATAAPAHQQAAKRANCTVTIHSPGRVKIAGLDNKYNYQITGCETPGVFVAVAELNSPTGAFYDALGWGDKANHNAAGTNSVLDFKATDRPSVGTYRISANNGSTCNETGAACAQAGEEIHSWGPLPTTDVRYGTLAGIAASCTATKISVHGLLKRFVGTKWVNYPNRLVTLKQYKNGGWASVGYVHSGADGKFVGLVNRTAGAQYRWGLPDSTSYWGTSSVTAHC